jgi:hypothetical protein
MRREGSSPYMLMAVLGFFAAAILPFVTETVNYTIALHPNGYATDHRKEHPFVLTGAAFAVFSGLSFLAAALASRDGREGRRTDDAGLPGARGGTGGTDPRIRE